MVPYVLKKMKTRIYATPAVKGLKTIVVVTGTMPVTITRPSRENGKVRIEYNKLGR